VDDKNKAQEAYIPVYFSSLNSGKFSSALPIARGKYTKSVYVSYAVRTGILRTADTQPCELPAVTDERVKDSMHESEEIRVMTKACFCASRD